MSRGMIVGWLAGVIISVMILVFVIIPLPGENVGLSFINGFVCTFCGGLFGHAMDPHEL